jgi:anti-anti-sigma regulatory factor
MNRKFHAAVHLKDDVTYVKLGGVIDEDNELGELTEKIPAGTVAIDLSEIDRINSCGVRDWVNWLTRVEKNGSRVILVECSPSIVAQINLVNNFTGGGVVKSFFAPYFCPNCDREKVLLVEVAEMVGTPTKAPTCRCDECDGVMDFDDMEDSYFAFLSTAKKVSEAARITAVMSEMGGADAEKSKIRSRVGTGAQPIQAQQTSLPSVPSIPSLRPGSTGGFAPGLTTGATPSQISQSGRFGGGSHPGGQNGTSSFDPGRASQEMLRPAMAVDGPRSGKMVYVLVFVLIAAIAVLAILLFSGGNAPRRGEAPVAPASSASN